MGGEERSREGDPHGGLDAQSEEGHPPETDKYWGTFGKMDTKANQKGEGWTPTKGARRRRRWQM